MPAETVPTAPVPVTPEETTVAKSPSEDFTDDQVNDILQQGDVGTLEPKQRSRFLYRLSEILKLNPFSRPFDLIHVKKGDGSKKLIIYANKSCADQIRERDGLTVTLVDEGPFQIGEEIKPEIYCVRVLIKGKDKDGEERTEPAIGAVSLAGLGGEDFANAIMKCHTKAARRGTLAFAGLGFPDESEVSSIPGIVQEKGGAGKPTVHAPPAIEAQVVSAPLPRAKASQPPVKVQP